MRVGRIVASALVFLPLLLICAGRVNAQRGGTPQGMTQEVNRCLTVMRVAASRRRSTRERRRRDLAAGVQNDRCRAFDRPQYQNARTA